ncbi:MAG: hypothetical protein CMD33_03890 [Flavobacteriales bacterium]|nr:hypothetical protein [Flavobacteriales bacterium]
MDEALVFLVAVAIACWLAYALFAWKVGARMNASKPVSIPSTEHSSELTVLIPCRNEAHALPHLLKDLSAQSHPVRIVVIDDASTDHTGLAAQEADVKCIAAVGSGKKAALKTGFEQVQTPWVATVDADVRLGVDWARSLLSSADQQNPACVLGGVVIDANPSTAWNRFQQLEFAVMQAWIAGGVQSNQLAMGSGANSLYATADYPVNALQPEWASGDDAFALLSLREANKPIYWCGLPSARVYTAAAANWKTLWQQRARWASKTGGQDAETKQTALIIAAVHVVPIALAVGVIAVGRPSDLWILIGYFAAKSLIDWRLLSLACQEFGIPWRTGDALLFQFRYSFLVWGAWWQLLRGGIQWKGRRI